MLLLGSKFLKNFKKHSRVDGSPRRFYTIFKLRKYRHSDVILNQI